jgi:hypothetical protein
MNILVDDVVRIIFSYLDTEQLYLIRQVNKNCLTIIGESCNPCDNTKVVIWALDRGYLEVFKWIVKRHLIHVYAICATVACHGHYEFLKYLRLKGYGWNSNTCYKPATCDHVSLLKYATINNLI